MIWLLLTGAGLVAETMLIVALGRRAMANDRQHDGQVRSATSSVAPSDQTAAQ